MIAVLQLIKAVSVVQCVGWRRRAITRPA